MAERQGMEGRIQGAGDVAFHAPILGEDRLPPELLARMREQGTQGGGRSRAGGAMTRHPPHVAAMVAVIAVAAACQPGDKPQAATSAPAASTPALAPGQLACVYNRSDGKLIGALLSARPAGDGANQIVTVAVDPELDPSGGIAPGTRWEITVPKNGTVRPCDTAGR